MEENLDSLMCAINIIKSHCKKYNSCQDCVLYYEREDRCRITSSSNDFPCEWDKPEIKARKEIIF